MKTIYLEIENRQSKTTKSLSKNMLWYDCKNQKMKRFVGSELKFKYDIDREEMIPYVENDSAKAGSNPKLLNEIIYEKVSNKKKLLDWILSNQLLLDFSLNEEETKGNLIVIDVSDSTESLVKESLDREGIRYS